MRSDVHVPGVLRGLRIPAVAAPLFIISTPELVIAQCKAGIVGSFPALNAREAPGEPVALEAWLRQITEALDAHNQANPDRPAAPFAVNQIVHRSNTRLERDLEICARWKVPIWITSLGARPEVNEAAHSCGGIALHDVINNTFARKAIAEGADGALPKGPSKPKAWSEVWGSGQGIGAVDSIVPAAERVHRIASEYETALAEMAQHANGRA